MIYRIGGTAGGTRRFRAGGRWSSQASLMGRESAKSWTWARRAVGVGVLN